MKHTLIMLGHNIHIKIMLIGNQFHKTCIQCPTDHMQATDQHLADHVCHSMAIQVIWTAHTNIIKVLSLISKVIATKVIAQNRYLIILFGVPPNQYYVFVRRDKLSSQCVHAFLFSLANNVDDEYTLVSTSSFIFFKYDRCKEYQSRFI